MITLSITTTYFMVLTSFILGIIATELDLRRNLNHNSRRVPMVFGKDILLEK